MNRIYSLVWNRALRIVQVASEIARTRGGGGAAGDGVRAGLPKSLALALAVALVTQVAPTAFAATGMTRTAAVPRTGSAAGGVMQPLVVCVLGVPDGGGFHTDCGGGGGGGGGGTSTTYGAGGGGGYGGGGYNSATKTWDTSGNGTAGTAGTAGSSGTGGTAGTGGAIAGAGNAGVVGTGTGGGGGGGGGGAGYALIANSTNTNTGGTWSGGAGGAGGSAGNSNGYAGGGGAGGAGVLMTSGSALSLAGNATVTGGKGGAAGNTGKGASAGSGGVGVVMLGNAALTVADATIAGGMSGDSTPIQADAVELAGGGNTLMLEVGSAVTGNIVSTSGTTNGDTLVLADNTSGGGSDSLDMGTVSGFANFEKMGTSTWALTGTNAGATPWTFSQGTLNVGSNGALGMGAVGMAAGTTLGFAVGGLSLANAFTLNGDPTYNVPAGQTDTISGVIADGTTPGTLELAGGGTLVLTATNTYTGDTDVNAGMLALSGNGSVASSSDVNLASGGTFDVSGTNTGASIVSLNGAFNSTVNLGTQTLTLTSAAGTFAGAINGTGGLTVSGGTETLSGANAFTGATTIDNGATLVGSPTLGAAFLGLQDTSALNLDNGTLALANSQWSTNAAVTLGSGGGTFSITGTTGGQHRYLQLDGVISGAGALAFIADGSDSLTLSNGGNAFEGGVTLTRATPFAPGATPALNVTATGALGTGDVTLNIGTAMSFHSPGSDASGNPIGVSAGQRTINLLGANTLYFLNATTAGGATITAAGQTMGGSYINFAGGSDAGTSTIGVGSADVLVFNGGLGTTPGASAASAVIHNGQGNGSFAFTRFMSGSTAGNATINNTYGVTSFYAGSTAGSASITNGYISATELNDAAAGTANFTNAGSSYLPGGANANNMNYFSGGVLEIIGSTDASQATVVNNSGGAVYVSAYRGQSTVDPSIGSLSGAGAVLLGSNFTAVTQGGITTYQATPFTLTLGALGKNDTISGVIRDDALNATGGTSVGDGITKVGTGTLTLNGINTYTGLTEVANGTLLVGGDSADAAASIAGDAQVDSGATLGGFGTVGATGTTTEVKNGGVLSPGTGGAIGTLAFGGNLTLEDGSVLDYDLGAAGATHPFAVLGTSDGVNVGGTLTFNGTSTLNLAGANLAGPGLYNIATYGSLATPDCSFGGGTACIALGPSAGANASNWSIIDNANPSGAGGQIDLYNTAGQTLNIWDPSGDTSQLGGDGTWSAGSATWTSPSGDGPGMMAPQPGFAIFQGTPGTVTVSGDVSVTGMQFAVDGYTLQSDAVNGGSVVLMGDSAGNAPVIEVGDGSSASTGMTATIAVSLDDADGFTKTGAGTLVLNAPGVWQVGAVAVNGGTLQVGVGGASEPGVEAGLTMASGTSVVVNNGGLLGLGASGAVVSGQNFNLLLQTTGAGGFSAILAGFAGGGASAIQGAGFTATISGNSAVAGAAGVAGQSGGTGAAAVDGSGFTITNSSEGAFQGRNLGITGGAGSYAQTGAAGGGGAGVTGSDFTVTNSGDIFGGVGGGANTGTAGLGGAGVSGSGFTVNNTGTITGGVGGASGYGGAGGAGGVGVSSSGGSTVTNSGTITGGAAKNVGDGKPSAGGAGIVAAAGDSIANTGSITGGEGGYGQSRPATGGVGIDATGRVSIVTSGSIAGGACGGRFYGCAGLGLGLDAVPADAVDMSNGGNSLTLESGFSFTGNVVSSSGTGASAVDGGDTLALGGDTNDTFDVSNIVDSLPAAATATQYVGINQFAKTGSSTWVLTGTTASVTPWTLDDGTLSVSSDTNLGAAAGTLTFAGGTLENTAAFSTARNVALNSTGAFQTDADLTVSGVISGSGSIAKTGSATLTLPGANTFTGGTNIDAGEVDVGNDASLGTGKVAMAAGTTLGFAANGLDLVNGFALSGDPAFNVATASQTDTVSGVIADGSAPGVLEKTGDGALILLGANTYSGGTTITAGTLQVGNGGTSGAIGTGAIVDNGTLVFDRSDAVALPGGLTGTGALIQQGSGPFTVNGDDSAFAGTTTIKSGTATVGDDSHAAASLGGMVTIAKGAKLTGIGTIGGLDLSGALSPGNSVGTFHVTGDATFEAGSTFNVEANADGTADQLAVGGKTTIKGGNTVVLSQPGNWAPRTTYTIITSGRGVSGQFAGVSDDQAFLTPTLAYGAKDVSLTLARNDINFATVAATPNQKGAATGIEGTGFGNPLYDAVVKLTAADARVAFDQTSDEYHASQQTARVEDSRYIREAMNQRLRNGDNDPEADKIGHLTAWAHGWGHWGTVDSDGNAAKLSDNGDGLLIGADMPVGAARVGVTGGASRNSLSVNDRNSWGRETSTWLGAFAGIDMNAFSLRGGLAYAWDRIPTNREVNFLGYSDRLSGNASGDTLTGFIEGAWTFKFGQSEITPFLNVAHTKVETDASTEAGGAAALHAFDATTNVSFSTLGARGAIDFAHNLNLHGELGWQHAFGDTTPEANLQFAAGGPAFTEYGVPIAKNAGLGRIGVGWRQGNIALNADYEGLAGNGVKDQAAKVSVSITF